MSIPITAIVLTKNEEFGLRTTLSHLADFSEVVVIDSNSTDRTVQIARECGARVIAFTWNEKYPKKKQWALDNAEAKNRWILLLDADEYPSNALVAELRSLMHSGIPGSVGAYDLDLRYKFAGRFLRHGHKVTKRSLLRSGDVRFPEVDDLEAPGIREVEGHYQPQTHLDVRKARNPLMHDDKDSVTTWFERHNRYSDWEAHLRLQAHRRRAVAANRSLKGQLFERVPFKPLAFFVYGYVLRLGFLDGRPGFDYHFALTAYYWQIALKERELRNNTVAAKN